MKLPLSIPLLSAVIFCAWVGQTFADRISLVPMADGTVQVSGSGFSNLSYSIQATTDLANPAWTPLATVSADTNGIFNFVDVDATNHSNRFYRGVQATATTFGSGLTAKQTIAISGGAIDSFNSSVAPYTYGSYGGNVVVLSDTNATGAIKLNAVFIFGMVVTPPLGTVTLVGSASAVGDTNWIATGNVGIQPGHYTNNANFQFIDWPAPYTSGAALTGGIVNGTNYTYVIDGNLHPNYYADWLSLSSQNMLVQGCATLYVKGSFIVSGTGYIYLAPDSSLTLYVGGTATISGGGIVNSTGLAKNISIYGLPSCTGLTYSGSSSFIGTLNAPEASVTITGGNNLFGAIVANTIAVSGGVVIHFDEALSNR